MWPRGMCDRIFPRDTPLHPRVTRTARTPLQLASLTPAPAPRSFAQLMSMKPFITTIHRPLDDAEKEQLNVEHIREQKKELRQAEKEREAASTPHASTELPAAVPVPSPFASAGISPHSRRLRGQHLHCRPAGAVWYNSTTAASLVQGQYAKCSLRACLSCVEFLPSELRIGLAGAAKGILCRGRALRGVVASCDNGAGRGIPHAARTFARRVAGPSAPHFIHLGRGRPPGPLRRLLALPRTRQRSVAAPRAHAGTWQQADR